VKHCTFWGETADDEHLVAAIIAGFKTATCEPKIWAEDPDSDEEPAEVGEQVAVLSKRGRHLCTIEITESYEVAFGQVEAKLIAGEACRDLAQFKEAHRKAWGKDLKRDGHPLTDDTVLIAQHFRLVSVEPAGRTLIGAAPADAEADKAG
jgi:uncharacterized protein YhfF